MAGVLLNAVAQLALKAGTNRVGEFAFALDNVVPIGLKLITNPFIGFIVIGVFLVARA